MIKLKNKKTKQEIDGTDIMQDLIENIMTGVIEHTIKFVEKEKLQKEYKAYCKENPITIKQMPDLKERTKEMIKERAEEDNKNMRYIG